VVKSNFTVWCYQNLSNCALNALTVLSIYIIVINVVARTLHSYV